MLNLLRTLVEVRCLALRVDISLIIVIHVGFVLFFVIFFLISLGGIASGLLRHYVLFRAQSRGHNFAVVVRVQLLMSRIFSASSRSGTLDCGILLTSMVHDCALVIHD
jgi:hypothetical protein